MDRNQIVWVLECCMLSLDRVSKSKMLEFGASKEEAEMGVQLYEYLKNKQIVIEVLNGY